MLLGRWQSNPSHCLPVAPPCLCLVCTSVSLRVLFLFYFFLQGTRGIFAPCACGLSLFSCVRRFATPCPPPGDLPNPGIEPMSLMSPALAGQFFTTRTTWGAHLVPQSGIKPTSPAVEAWILHPWAARKVPLSSSYKDPGHCAEDPSRGCPSPPPQVSHLLPAAVPVCFGDESGPPLALWPLSACLASSPSAHTWCPCCIAGQGCHNLCAFADSVPSA